MMDASGAPMNVCAHVWHACAQEQTKEMQKAQLAAETQQELGGPHRPGRVGVHALLGGTHWPGRVGVDEDAMLGGPHWPGRVGVGKDALLGGTHRPGRAGVDMGGERRRLQDAWSLRVS